MEHGFEEYLNELQLNKLNGILRCRTIKTFTAEEELACDLLKHDYFYSHSDAGNTVAVFGRNEKRLIDYLEVTTGLNDQVRKDMLATFEIAPELAVGWLESTYGYLHGRNYLDTNPTGIVGAILNGLTVAEYKTFLTVNERLQEIHEALNKGDLFGRILDTTDLPDYRKLREFAAVRFQETKSRYYFGLLLPASIQNMVDDLVKYYKAELLELSKKWGEVLFPEFEAIEWEADKNVIELRICVTGDFAKHFGLFLNLKESRQRRKAPEAVKRAPAPHVPAEAVSSPAVATKPSAPIAKPRPLAPSKPMVVNTTPTVKKPVQKVAPKKRESRTVLGNGFEALKALQA